MPISTRSSLSSQNASKWRTELSTHATKNTLRTRMKAFFSYESQRKIHITQYKRWQEILKHKQSSWEIRAMADIAKNIPLQTVKISNIGTAFKDRIQFLYPFSDDMEGPTIRGPRTSSTETESHTTENTETPIPPGPTGTPRVQHTHVSDLTTKTKSVVRKTTPSRPTPTPRLRWRHG